MIKTIKAVQELLYGAEPQLQREMLTLWVEEIMEEVAWKIAENYKKGVGETIEGLDDIEKQLRDDQDSRADS